MADGPAKGHDHHPAAAPAETVHGNVSRPGTVHEQPAASHTAIMGDRLPQEPVAHHAPPASEMLTAPPGAKVSPGSVKAGDAPAVAHNTGIGPSGPPGILKKKPSRPDNREGRVHGPATVVPSALPAIVSDASHGAPPPLHELANVPDAPDVVHDGGVVPMATVAHPGETVVLPAHAPGTAASRPGSIGGKASKPGYLASGPGKVKPSPPAPPAAASHAGGPASVAHDDAVHHDPPHEHMPELVHDAGVNVVKPPPGKLRKPSRAGSAAGHPPAGGADHAGHGSGHPQSLHSMAHVDPDTGDVISTEPPGTAGKGSPATSLKNVGGAPTTLADPDEVAAERERAQSEWHPCSSHCS